jgi:hypothetical protein
MIVPTFVFAVPCAWLRHVTTLPMLNTSLAIIASKERYFNLVACREGGPILFLRWSANLGGK